VGIRDVFSKELIWDWVVVEAAPRWERAMFCAICDINIEGVDLKGRPEGKDWCYVLIFVLTAQSW